MEGAELANGIDQQYTPTGGGHGGSQESSGGGSAHATLAARDRYEATGAIPRTGRCGSSLAGAIELHRHAARSAARGAVSPNE